MDFCMNENDVQVVLQHLKTITVDDFSSICRVCLQVGENMTDIFKSGIENRFMEVTNLKMEEDDKLPRTLCHKCCNRMYQYSLFLKLAKSTDTFLRSLLPAVSDLSPDSTPTEENTVREKQYCKKKYKRKVTILEETKKDTESDKMYLIVVPKTDGSDIETDNKIHIKDLSSETDNLELTNYCKSIMRSHFSDHTYPKELKESEILNLNSSSYLRDQENKTYMVNLHVYKCSECEATYEEFTELTAHFSSHEVEPSFYKSDFNCPICGFTEGEKISFLSHLKAHKKEGFAFVKVNTEGDAAPLKENEEDLFTESFSQNTKVCKIFRLSPNSLICTLCSQNIQSIESIPDHLESCLCGVETVIKFNIRYKCPICYKIFFDEEKNFINHLSSHKEDNNYFIKVDSKGELVQVADHEKLFTPFGEATKILSGKDTIFEIVNVNACDKCDYVSECFNDLCNHSNEIHFENLSNEISFFCPVCAVEFKGTSVDETKAEFYEHLRVHKNEGLCFILVKKEGTVCDFKENYSDVFTQSQFLCSLIHSSGLVFQNISPELVVWDPKTSSGKYTCDVCQKQFKSKNKISMHLKSHEVEERVQDSVNYICEKCGKKFSRRANYKKHFLKHLKVLSTASRRPVCTICNKKFANRASYDSHIRHHLKEANGNEFQTSLPGIICDKCGRSFSNNASLTRHKKSHLKEKENTLYKCDICHREFFRQASFERHKAAHLNPKYYECGICRLPLPTVASLQKHLEIHKNGSKTFDCKNCQLSFLTKDSLTAHQSHTGHYVDKKPFECNVCHEKFFIGKKFSEHIKTHPKYKVGECTLCGKRLSTPDSLMKHRRRHFESNTVLCPHCGKRFFEDKNYERHLLIHEGIKPFPCDMEGCEKAFYTGHELRRHKKYHSNERDFKCSYCPKSFNEASHLTTHIRTHTGERPYRCPHCNKGFQTRSHCKNHIKLIHQGVGYDLIRSNISKKVAFFEGVEVTDEDRMGC